MKSTVPKYFSTLVLAWLLLSSRSTFAQLVDASFTFQGSLSTAEGPAQGVYDFQFTLHNAETGDSPVGDPIVLLENTVANGQFTAPLDFGADAFDGQSLWLGIGVKPSESDGSFTILSPRQRISSVPYALYALHGNPGPEGPEGPPGPTGPPGTKGEKGDPGPQGPIGLTGATGPQGPMGLSGLQGPQGETGSQGEQGATGPAGPAGATGPKGSPGEQGPAGPQGPKGDKGDAGEQGPPGPQGPIGLTGATGPQGPMGLPGPQGPQGETGPQGLQGIAGLQGPTGPAGLSIEWLGSFSSGPANPSKNEAYYNEADGIAYVYDGDSWEMMARDGLDGLQGPEGPSGPQGLVGAAGPAGPQGSAGPQGDTGPQGPAGPRGPEGPPGSADAWSRTGNASTDPTTEFLGTIDDQPLDVRVNNELAFRVMPNAGGPRIGVGKADPATALDVNGTVTAAAFVGDGSGLTGIWNESSSTIGTTDNQPFELQVNGQRAFRLEPGYDDSGDFAPNTIGGTTANQAGANVFGASIGGGGEPINPNRVLVGGYGTVSGGYGNTVNNSYATVGGGAFNTATGRYSSVPGGWANQANGDYSFAAGRSAKADHDGAFVWADGSTTSNFTSARDNEFAIRAAGGVRIVGAENDGFESAPPSLLAALRIDSSYMGDSQTLLLDGNEIESLGTLWINRSSGQNVSLANGGGNVGIGTSTPASKLEVAGTVTAPTFAGPGSQALEFHANGQRVLRIEPLNHAGFGFAPNTIAGSSINVVSAGTVGATIAGGGGAGNPNVVDYHFGTVGGGRGNTADGYRATVAGGGANKAVESGATVGGGVFNTAAGIDATVGGGGGNEANGLASTIPGGGNNRADGRYSFAAGRGAKALHDGAFVWADSSSFDFASNVPNKVRFRCVNGFDIITGIDASGNQTHGVFLAPGDSSWNTISDRARKEDFREVDLRDALEKVAALPITTWHYKAQSGTPIRHMGPMAQDFRAAFGLGPDDKHISTVDADGVALAAIQGLNLKVTELSKENATLKQEVAELKQLVHSLISSSDRGDL